MCSSDLTGMLAPPGIDRRATFPTVARRSKTPVTAYLLMTYPWPGNIRELRNVMRRVALFARDKLEPEHLCLAGLHTSSLSYRYSSVQGTAAVLLSGSEDHPQLDETNSMADPASPVEQVSLKEAVRRSIVITERKVLKWTLQLTNGNLAEAARRLGVDYKTIRTKARQYNLSQAD